MRRLWPCVFVFCFLTRVSYQRGRSWDADYSPVT